MVYRYDSTEKFAESCKGIYSDYTADSWTNYQTLPQAISNAMQGVDSYVKDAEKLLKQIDSEVEVPTRQWTPSVFGAYAVVPDYLSNSPECMRHLHQVEREDSPISIYVSTTCSAGVNSETMRKRGVSIMALLLKMQQIRPVELYLLAETHGIKDGECLQVIRVESRPLNLATACYAICDVAFARQLTYNNARQLDRFNGCWPDRYNHGGKDWEVHVREVLGMTPIDLYVGAGRLWDDTLASNPIGWVNKQIKRFVEGEGEVKDYE